ncbi:hypothetical protein [Acidisphaera sp. L21]|uniref:hypothetical protein n=1 Tax=Acidisphaera sp. L21 TaxID=1641851 RepID=UPI001C209D20|nr:hypothetical protein [Acidisphaera sp. L21]
MIEVILIEALAHCKTRHFTGSRQLIQRQSRRRPVKTAPYLVRLWTPTDLTREIITIDQAALRHAIREQREVQFTYQDQRGTATGRVAAP